MASTACLWQVVGGAAGSGILVRTGREISSEKVSERLATGALVKALEHDDQSGRLHFELVSGIGPATGWVSTKVQGKALLVKTKQATLMKEEEVVAEDGGEDVNDQTNQAQKILPESLVRAEIERDLCIKSQDQIIPLGKRQGKPGLLGKSQYEVAEDSDEEEVHLCLQCGLPLGDRAYKRDGTYMHGECVAQLMLHSLNEEEAARQQKEKGKKAARRMDFDIRWGIEQIPCNDSLAKKLECPSSPHSMLCVQLREDDMSASLTSTTKPAASVNLEYLSTALEVRRREGREPIFSLDPTNLDKKHAMMEKVFVPEWLAGTSAGEVMFQADYHLKELSMGECEQPVVGMRSCFDYSEIEGFDKEWSAREWFMVREAEVHVADGGMLLPYVKMGVQAREQVVSSSGTGLEDAALTRSDHPMVKYAESFTHNFDLIAERKSVIYHLRELAKASVLAKFLLDYRIKLEDSWFHLADESTTICSSGWEVPQLWNERMHSQVEVKDGALVDAKKLAHKGPVATTHGIYGGIDFGLDNFSLAAGLVTRMGRPGRRTAGLSTFELTGAKPPTTEGRRGFGLGAFDLQSLPPSYLSAAPVIGDGAQPQGVDLCLDKFSFKPKRITLEASAIQPLDAADVSGKNFWSCIDDSARLFKDADTKLLKEIFNPHLSDRRIEGDRFTMPDTSCSRVEKLRMLVKDEEVARQQRKDHFYSEKFSAGEPGPLFPSSWTSSVCMTRGSVPLKLASGRHAHGILHPRPNFLAEAPTLLQALKSAVATFDKRTEDGVRFRMYTLGSLEVRTTQEAGGEEEVGAVFSVRPSDVSTSQKGHIVSEDEQIVKFTEYVETLQSSVDHKIQRGHRIPSRYYLVLETDQGHRLVTEQTPGGSTKLEEDQGKLEDRVSLAKALRSSECTRRVTIEDFKKFRSATRCAGLDGASSSASKHLARQAYAWLSAAPGHGSTSTVQPAVTHAWQNSSSALEMQRKPSDLQLMAQCFRWT